MQPHGNTVARATRPHSGGLAHHRRRPTRGHSANTEGSGGICADEAQRVPGGRCSGNVVRVRPARDGLGPVGTDGSSDGRAGAARPLRRRVGTADRQPRASGGAPRRTHHHCDRRIIHPRRPHRIESPSLRDQLHHRVPGIRRRLQYLDRLFRLDCDGGNASGSTATAMVAVGASALARRRDRNCGRPGGVSHAARGQRSHRR
jgi:hypothetical protein